ncbi:choline binding protein J [Streptococcus pneumoniae]|uniref:Choline binding protein J n=1 Tax=Streptococcus pneumoniae TaxID=1313 RepID=A0A4J1RQJ0_STREE|nr:choline binding protein J [Streptococcus pneumoniae]VMF14803.1 choline binding protein J [Streptococcus pneumoniae]VMF76839.1 choline binding protein J [Streptococcus pneumoniae]VMJ17184.1 choline binding protein J [Streptococcus pneumoniae]VNA62341.1 choline binding protein J [Streptococcus pneumoniae]
MKLLKKTMQAGLTVIFFGLLATNTVFADNSEGWQFVQENGRTYYKKGDLKETYWRVIDGKYYYFDSLSGEMVVGWQYIPFPSKGSTIGPYPNGIRLEGFPKSEWYYFDKNGVLQEFVGWKELEIKTQDSVGRKYGEKRENSEDKEEKRYYTNYYFNQNHSLETGWLYDQSNWYYLAKTEINGENYIGGERRAGWINDASAWYYLDPATGWYQDGSTWYYLNAGNGDMKTGWFQVNGNWYYAYSSGALAVNTTVDGYSVNYNGEWVR